MSLDMSTFPTGQYNFIYYDESPSSEGKEAAAPYMKWKSASKPHLLVFASTDGSHSGVASREIARHGKVMTSPNADVSRDSTQFVGAAITNCDKPDEPITAAVCGPAWVTNNSDECLLELDRVEAVAPYPTTEVGESFLVRRHKRPPQHELLRETVFPIGVVLCSANKRARATVLLRRPTSRAIETACIKRGLLRSPSIPLAVLVAEAAALLRPPLLAAANAAEADADANLREIRDARTRTDDARVSVAVIRARVEEATGRVGPLCKRLLVRQRSETKGSEPCVVYRAVRKKLCERYDAHRPLLTNCVRDFASIDTASNELAVYSGNAVRDHASLHDAVVAATASRTVADTRENKELAERYARDVLRWACLSGASVTVAENTANGVIARGVSVQAAIDAVFDNMELVACVAALDAEDIELAGVAATTAIMAIASCVADLRAFDARMSAACAGCDVTKTTCGLEGQSITELYRHLSAKHTATAAAGDPHANAWGCAFTAIDLLIPTYNTTVRVVTNSIHQTNAIQYAVRARELLDGAIVINTDVQDNARARAGHASVADAQNWERFTEDVAARVRRFADEAVSLTDHAEQALVDFGVEENAMHTEVGRILADMDIRAAIAIEAPPALAPQFQADVTAATEVKSRAEAAAQAATAQATAATQAAAQQRAAVPQAVAVVRAEATARVMAAAQTAAEVVARAAAAEQTAAETRERDARAVLAQATADAARALTDAPAAAAAAAVAVNSYNDATTQAAATAARADASAQALAVARAAEAAADATDVVAFAVVQRATAAAQAAADAHKLAADTAAATVTHALADVQATAATQASTATAHADAEARVMAAQAALTQATADTRAAETARAEATTQAMAAQTAATAARALVAPAVVAAAPAPAAAAAVAAPAAVVAAAPAPAVVAAPAAVPLTQDEIDASPTGVSTGTPTAANTRGGVARKKK